MDLLQLIQTLGPVAAVAIYAFYSEVKNRRLAVKAKSQQSEADSEIKKALALLVTQQQAQTERLDAQNQAVLAENIVLRERVASFEGGLSVIQQTANEDRDRWAKREIEHQQEQLKTQKKIVQLELRLEQQQVTIDRMSKELADGGREIRRLQSERDTMRFENTRLGASNKALTERLNSLQSRRERLEAEAGERDTQIIEMQRRLTACEETNEVSKKITDIPKDDNPPTQEQDIA